ncbi:hypothetical protein TM49_07870 [Martelella endophytica]|uniref:Uncharacterized protein n=1 Tax=Martelella endophytica TaxID=1486262 RepID=A0A0D5LN99_MAREN|nr:hypothetical protein TM49_07870 [Martelella endophytica]
MALGRHHTPMPAGGASTPSVQTELFRSPTEAGTIKRFQRLHKPPNALIGIGVLCLKIGNLGFRASARAAFCAMESANA